MTHLLQKISQLPRRTYVAVRDASPLRWLLGGSAMAAGIIYVAAQSTATTAIGSYVELGSQVVAPASSPTLHSTSAITSGDTVQWTHYLNSRINSPYEADGVQELPAGFKWVSGSAKLPPTATLTGWKVAGGWVTAEPANGTVVEAFRWHIDPMKKFVFEAVGGVVGFQGTGDGYHVIPYKDNLYVVNHHSSAAYLNCRVAKTALPCPGFHFTGAGYSVSPTAGEDFSSGASAGLTPNRSIAHMNYATGELFFSVKRPSDQMVGVACANLDTLKSCGFIPSGYIETGFYGTQGLGSVGSKYYFMGDSGRLYCLNTDAKTPCAGHNYPVFSNIGSATNLTSVIHGGKVFFETNNKAYCFDPVTNQSCAGWNFAGKIWAQGMFPVLDQAGIPVAVCGVNGGSGVCNYLNGNNFTPTQNYINFLNANPFLNVSFSLASTYGTRVYHSNQTDAAKCFDFAANSLCAGTFPVGPNNGGSTYSIINDPTRPGCLWSVGDAAIAHGFDAFTGGMCKGAGSITQPVVLSIDPSTYYPCDNTRAHVSRWGKVRVSPSIGWGSNALNNVKVTITDWAGNPIANNPVRNFPANQFQLDISDIPYTQYPKLKFEVVMQSAGQINLTVAAGVDVTWEGDPIQFCAQTTAPNVDCQIGSKLTVQTRAVDYTTGIYQETLVVDKVHTPGSLGDGFAASTAASALRNLSQASPAETVYVLQGRYALSNFSGDLHSYTTNSSGGVNLSVVQSKASDITPLGSASSRPMFAAKAAQTSANNSHSGNMTLFPLSYGGASSYQQTDLNTGLTGVQDNQGAARVNYLRGVNGSFRPRATPLGPVIDSAPVVLHTQPRAGLSEALFPGYDAYRRAQGRASPLAIYGGNDGALHAYAITPTGLQDAYSFVPDVMLRRATQYSDPDLAGIRRNPYFVNNIPMLGHINTGSATSPAWRAVAGLTYGRGARAVTALDVSKANISQGDGVYFEYNNTYQAPEAVTSRAAVIANNGSPSINAVYSDDLADLGYIVSQPVMDDVLGSEQMVQIKNGNAKRWALLVGNGIRSNDNAGGPQFSGTGKAVLYVLYFDKTAGGQRWHRIAVDEWVQGLVTADLARLKTNNGLSTPRAVDTDSDGVVDVVYAGDIQGNMWRFDVKDPSQPVVKLLFKTDSTNTTSVTQPIYQAPFAKRHAVSSACQGIGNDNKPKANKCWQITFGTGENLTPLVGSTNTAQQFVYSVLDFGLNDTVQEGNLVLQTYNAATTVNQRDYRDLSANAVDYMAGKRGWRIQLPAQEHAVGAIRPQPSGLLMFTSFKPKVAGVGSAQCSAATSWINNVHPLTGTNTLVTHDTNGDGVIDNSDRLGGAGGKAASSMALATPLYSTPTVLRELKESGNQASLLLPSLGVGLANAPNGNVATANPARVGRMSWREVYRP